MDYTPKRLLRVSTYTVGLDFASLSQLTSFPFRTEHL